MSKRVLIVDDSFIVRQQIAKSLTQAGYEAIQAADGQEGLHKAETTSDLKMVICDFNMPVLNGLGMLTQLKEKGLISQFPVLMLTSEVDPALIALAKSLGVKAWMVKPVNGNAIVATVKKFIQ